MPQSLIGALGLVIQTLVLLGAVIGVYVAIERRMTKLETKIEPLWRMFERRGSTGTSGKGDA